MLDNERLASVETKMEMLLEMLRDIKDNLKGNPSREEFDDLKRAMTVLEDKYNKLVWKVAGAGGTMTVVVALTLWLAKALIGK